MASTVEKRAVQAIEQNLDGVVGTPTVDIGGFPFLTQVLKGSLDEVTGQVDGVTIEGIHATDVTVDATDVTHVRAVHGGHRDHLGDAADRVDRQDRRRPDEARHHHERRRRAR